MKKLILFSVFLLSIGFVQAQSQPKLPTADELAKKNVDEMEKRLKLTSTQKGIINNYAYEMAKEQVAILKKQQAGTFQNEDGTRYYRLLNDFNAKAKTVLKEEQITEFNKLIEDRLSGVDPDKKKKKKKKGEEEEKVVGIEGLKSAGPPSNM